MQQKPTADDAAGQPAVNRRPARAPGVMLRHVAGQALLIPVTGKLVDLQRIYALNDTGRIAWEQLDGTRGVDEIAQAVAEATEGSSPDRVAADVAGFVALLRAEGLAVETG